MKKKKPAINSTALDENTVLITLRKNTLAIAVSAAMTGIVMLPTSIYAQDAEEEADNDVIEVIEEVITYGKYSKSLYNSQEFKRQNTSIVEAISAEDIGKLPDVSIAESLSRLPGVTVQRLNGRGQVVNLRGMSPDFSTGLLNGREQVSVGDNRGVEFDQYPSELLQQVVIYKTPDAALIGQGLSGTVDMRTVRPLDHGKRDLSLNARFETAEYDLVSNRDNTGEKFSATYIDQFSNETVGLLFGYAHATTPSFGKNNNAWGYYVGDGAGNVAVGGGRVWARASELDRDSIVAALDLAPNDRLSIGIDAFFSSFKEDQIKHGLVFNLDGGALTATSTANGVVTEGSYGGNTKLATENNVFLRDADVQSFGTNIQYGLNDDWMFTADLSHSSVDRSDTAEFESNGALGGAGGLTDIVGFRTSSTGTQFSVGRDYSNLDYSTPDALYATSPFGWGDPNALAPYAPAGQFGYNKVFDIEDDLNAFRFELERELNWKAISGVELGYNLASRDKFRVANEGVITSGITGTDGLLLTETEIPASIAGIADLSFALYGANTSLVSYNPYDLLASGAIQQGAYLYDDISAKAWKVSEDVNTVYTKFEFDSVFAGKLLTGNFGFSYQFWDQDSSGQTASGAGTGIVTEAFSGGDSDSEILPSLNLSLDITDNQILRFGAARTLARPRMDEMRASGFYRLSNDAISLARTDADIQALAVADGISELEAYRQYSPWSRDTGNPELKPWLADNYDLSYEYYFEGSASYLAAAMFHRGLSSYIYNQPTLFDFTGLPISGTDTPSTFTGVNSRPANGEGGYVKGWELSTNIGFDMFSETLAGLGVTATYSSNDSNVEPFGPESASKLPGLSDSVWNAAMYYERNGFSARVNQRYRDSFIGEISGFGGNRTGSDIAEETILDAQVSYEIQSGRFTGLNLLFQGLNLTDEPYQSIDVGTGLPTEYQTFGSTYLLGVSWSMNDE